METNKDKVPETTQTNPLNTPLNNPVNDISQPRIDNLQQNQPPLSTKSKANYWMVSTIVLLLVALIGGFFYLYKRNLFPTVSNPNIATTQPTTEPSDNYLPTETAVNKSNQIRMGGVRFSYPENWTPIFASSKGGKSLVYFTKTEQEAQQLAECASSSCGSYSLKLEDYANYAVWQNSTIEDFIKQVRSDIQLNTLQETTINGRDAWLGYTDTQKTKHQAIIDTGTSQDKSFVAITASTTNNNGMLEEYIAKLSTLKVSEYKSIKTNELSAKKGFVLDVTSKLNVQDMTLVNFVLDSLLAGKDLTQDYHYFLYLESTKNAGSSIGGSSYPKDSFLNNKYYLLTDNKQLTYGSYGTSQIQIKLSTPSTQNLGLYLADPKYCQQDNDCQYRGNFCSIGAYNPYHQFTTPWGCGPGDFEGLGNSMELQQQLGCQQDVEVKYDSLKCVSNSCQAINAKAVCKQ